MTQPPDTIEAALAAHMDRESDAPAWLTQTVERAFKVGDRVRVRWSAECDQQWPGETKKIGHWMELDGATGSVFIVDGPDSPYWPHHPYSIDLDRPVDLPDGSTAIGVCASAWELEPIEPAPEARP